jgi:exopolysaccharide production protein ExoQ
MTPAGLRAAAPRAAAPAGVPRKKDGKVQVFLVTAVYWLLIARVIIPGLFDYAPDTDVLQVAARDAVLNKVTWLSFLFIPLVLLASRSTLTMRVLRTTNRFFLILLAFATISVLWSIDAGASTSRLTHMLTVVLDCLAVAIVGWHATRVQQITRPILTIMLLGSLVFALFWPDLAITPPTPPDTHGYWHGLTTQKNGLGSLASLGTVFWFHGWVCKEVKTLPALLFGGLAVVLMVLSRSSTAVMATALVMMFLLLMLRSGSVPALRRYIPYMVGGFVCLTLAYSLAVLKVVPGMDILLVPITALSGKDTTFTARTQIWELIRAHIQYSPMIGSGYGGYWAGPIPTSPSYIFLNVMYFYPSEAHNGYLDVINDLGYVGLLLLLGYLIGYIRQALRLLRSNYTQSALYLAVIFQQLLTNLSETHWLFVGHDFIVLTMATFGLARSLLDAQAAAKAAGGQRPLRGQRA